MKNKQTNETNILKMSCGSGCRLRGCGLCGCCVCVFGSSAWCLYGICGHWCDPQWAGMWFSGEPVVLLRSESLLTVPASPQAAIDSPVWRTSWRIGHVSIPRRVGEIVTAPTMRGCELRWWMCWSTICPKCSLMSDDGQQACTFTVLLGI